MSREIEFRVWDKRNLKWVDVEFSSLTLNQIFTCDENLIFQQYTGLKDKNGKEIYEGDIVVVVFSGSESKPGTVSYDECNGKYMFGVFTIDSMRCIDRNAELKVVGNIFENPELINEN